MKQEVASRKIATVLQSNLVQLHDPSGGRRRFTDRIGILVPVPAAAEPAASIG
jgi:hypothetical protein